MPAPARVEVFGDRVAARVAARRSQLVLGLDPHPAQLWPEAVEGNAGTDAASPAERAAAAVAAHCALLIDAAGEACVAVKLQVACFERLGAAGWSALGTTVERARAAGLLVIADAKRGDVDVSASAYGQAFFGRQETPFGILPSLGADALTVNPLLGADALAPLVAAARGAGGGLFVLVRTSNPGAAEVQDAPLVAGGTVSERLAGLVAKAGRDGLGASGLADVGAVVGATAPAALFGLRALMPHAVLLLPGVGAQGGRVENLAPAWAPGPASALVTVSRGIAGAHERGGGAPAGAARAAAEALREATWRVAGG